jgi:hypothetical protein
MSALWCFIERFSRRCFCCDTKTSIFYAAHDSHCFADAVFFTPHCEHCRSSSFCSVDGEDLACDFFGINAEAPWSHFSFEEMQKEDLTWNYHVSCQFCRNALQIMALMVRSGWKWLYLKNDFTDILSCEILFDDTEHGNLSFTVKQGQTRVFSSLIIIKNNKHTSFEILRRAESRWLLVVSVLPTNASWRADCLRHTGQSFDLDLMSRWLAQSRWNVWLHDVVTSLLSSLPNDFWQIEHFFVADDIFILWKWKFSWTATAFKGTF